MTMTVEKMLADMNRWHFQVTRDCDTETWTAIRQAGRDGQVLVAAESKDLVNLYRVCGYLFKGLVEDLA